MIPFGPQKPSCVGSSLPSNFSHYTKVYLKQNKIVYWSMSWTLPTLWFAFNSGKYCGCNSMDWASSLTTMAGQENGWQLYSWYYSHKKHLAQLYHTLSYHLCWVLIWLEKLCCNFSANGLNYAMLRCAGPDGLFWTASSTHLATQVGMQGLLVVW